MPWCYHPIIKYSRRRKPILVYVSELTLLEILNSEIFLGKFPFFPGVYSFFFVIRFVFVLGVAGMCAKTAVAPLDRIKILLQAHSAHYKHLGVFSGLREIVQRESLVALYKGHYTSRPFLIQKVFFSILVIFE